MALYPSPDYQINWTFGSEKKCKIDFQDSSHGGHLGFLIRMILGLFYLHHPAASYFWINMPFSSGVEAKNRFSRWWLSWISDLNDLSYF